MKKNKLFICGLVLHGFSLLAMEQYEGIAKLKEISLDSSIIAKKCADNFSQECAILDAMFKHEKERRLALGKQLTEGNIQDFDDTPGVVLRNRLHRSYLCGCKNFFVCLSEQESQELEEALAELLKNETSEAIEKELNNIRRALR